MPILQHEGKIRQVAVSLIDTSPFQARTVFDEGELASLAQSIKENGILQPLSVRRVQGGRCQLIAGERRLRAAKMLGLKKVPCIFCSAGDVESFVLGITENLQRQDLNCFEEAAAMKKLLSLWGCSQAQAAARLGIAQPTLANKMRLLSLSAPLQELCVQGSLSERHARAVLRLESEEERETVLKKAVEGALTVSKTEEMVEQMLAKKSPPPAKKLRKGAIGDIRLFTNTLNKALAVMNEAGLAASAVRKDAEDYIEYVIHIPTQAKGQHEGQAK